MLYVMVYLYGRIINDKYSKAWYITILCTLV